MFDYYILDGHQPIKTNLATWAKWIETTKKYVVDELVGGVQISTVFVGLDHSFGRGSPLFFETMVFGGPLDGEQERYMTWEEAEIGHKRMVERVRNLNE